MSYWEIIYSVGPPEKAWIAKGGNVETHGRQECERRARQYRVERCVIKRFVCRGEDNPGVVLEEMLEAGRIKK